MQLQQQNNSLDKKIPYNNKDYLQQQQQNNTLDTKIPYNNKEHQQINRNTC